MMIENLLTNRVELSKSDQFFFDFQLVSLDAKFNEILKLDKIGYLIPISLIDFDNIRDEPTDRLFLEFKENCRGINQDCSKDNIYVIA